MATRPHTLTKYGVKQYEISEEEYLNLGKLVDDLQSEISKEGVCIARLKTWTQEDAKANVAKVKEYIEADEDHQKFHPEWLQRKTILTRSVFEINPVHDQTVDKIGASRLRRGQSQMKKSIRDFDFFAPNYNNETELETSLKDGGIGNCLDVMLDSLEGKHNNILYLTNMTLDEPLKTTATASMHNMKSNLESLGYKKIHGITVPSCYIGSPLSTFCCHIEDCAFLAVNRHIAGRKKIWFCIPSRYNSAFRRFLAMLPLPEQLRLLRCYMQHKQMWLDPRLIMRAGIPVYTIEQGPGDIVILLPNTIHFGFNVNFNMTEAMNFVSRTWILCGMTASQRCECKSQWKAKFELKQVFRDLSADEDLIAEWESGMLVNLNLRFKDESKMMYPHLRDMGDEPVNWCSLLGTAKDPLLEHHEDDSENEKINTGKWATCTRCNFCPKRYMGDATDRIYRHAVICHGEDVAKEILKEVQEQNQQKKFKTKGHDCELCGKNIKGNMSNMKSHQNSRLCKRPEEGEEEKAKKQRKF